MKKLIVICLGILALAGCGSSQKESLRQLEQEAHPATPAEIQAVENYAKESLREAKERREAVEE